MYDLKTLATKAQTSTKHRWLMTKMMRRFVPFNMPHRFKILEVQPHSMTVELPYKKKNLNHLKGLHACALATLAELTTGLSLLTQLDNRKYRIILKNLNMEYHYQGKSAAKATFTIDDAWLEREILNPLRENEKVLVNCPIEIYDTQNNHLATGQVLWQFKDWQKVKTQKN